MDTSLLGSLLSLINLIVAAAALVVWAGRAADKRVEKDQAENPDSRRTLCTHL